MNKEDFLYYYAKHYLQHNVHTTLLYENWFHKILDVKDAAYMQEYISIRNFVNNTHSLPAKVKLFLNFLKRLRIDTMYKKLFDNMIGLLEQKKKIKENKKKALKARLNVYRSLEYVNFQYMNELRKFEEESY